MGSLRRRLIRLEHSVAPESGPEPEVPPLNDQERAERGAYWLDRLHNHPDELSHDDRRRAEAIEYIFERARMRRDSV